MDTLNLLEILYLEATVMVKEGRLLEVINEEHIGAIALLLEILRKSFEAFPRGQSPSVAVNAKLLLSVCLEENSVFISSKFFFPEAFKEKEEEEIKVKDDDDGDEEEIDEEAEIFKIIA